MLGKFVHMAFTYKIKKAPEPKYIDAYGHIIRLENKNLLFKDNDNYEYIVDLNKIYDCTLAGRRRTVREWNKEVQEKVAKIKSTKL